MQEVIYVTEPGAIDMGKVKALLPERYELLAGDTSFGGDVPTDCTTLLIRSATQIGPSVRQVFPNLKTIIRIGTGVDTIDMAFCKQADIRVCTAAGANADAVSDYVVCMMLVALRKVFMLTPSDAAEWNRFKFTGHSLSAQSIGIVGFGNIGRLVYAKLQGFGCRSFCVYDPFVQHESLPKGVVYAPSVDAVLAQSTVVTLHLPLLPETHHIINGKNLALLPQGAVLLNAARGGIVDEMAAVKAAKSRGLVYVADTVEGEPAVRQELLQQAGVIITPHVASLTEESEDNMLQVAVENFLHQPATVGVV